MEYIMSVTNEKKVNEIQSHLNGMYASINANREWHEIYGYLARTTGFLTRNLLRKKATAQDFIRPLSWLIALANDVDVSLEESFIGKFPKICPYCLENVCCCIETKKKPKQTDIPAYRMREKRESATEQWLQFSDRTFKSFTNNLLVIYPGNKIIWNHSGPSSICSKLFEEVAELQEAIAKYKVGQFQKTAVEEEFADVLAWLLAAWSCQFPNVDISEFLKDYFYDGCPVCNESVCACSTDAARIQSVVDAEKFKEIRVQFEELKPLLESNGIELSELILSLKEIETTQSETSVNAAASQAQTIFERIKSKGNLQSMESISTVINNALQVFSNF